MRSLASLRAYDPADDDRRQALWEQQHDPVAYNHRLMNGAMNENGPLGLTNPAGVHGMLFDKYFRLLGDKGVSSVRAGGFGGRSIADDPRSTYNNNEFDFGAAINDPFAPRKGRR